MTTERKQAIAQEAAPQETWWFKELQEFWEASPDAITAAVKMALKHITAPHAPAPVQAEASALSLANLLVREMPHKFINDSTRNEIANVLMEGLSAAPVQAAPTEPEPEPCPNCDGGGTVYVMSDGGPDAYEVPIDCPHCNGNQTLSAAYAGVVKLLEQSERKHTTNYAIIWRRGLGDGDALTRMRDIADALKADPLNSTESWARARLLELAATYETATPAPVAAPAPVPPQTVMCRARTTNLCSCPAYECHGAVPPQQGAEAETNKYGYHAEADPETVKQLCAPMFATMQKSVEASQQGAPEASQEKQPRYTYGPGKTWVVLENPEDMPEASAAPVQDDTGEQA